jgi:hypothetical protein
MHTVVGHSDEVDSLDAIDEVLEQCRRRVNGEAPKGAILFSSIDYEHEVVLRRIQEEWPGLPLIGGSSDGEISSALGFRHDSVLMTLFCGDEIEVRAGLGRELSSDPVAAAHAASSANGCATPRVCITTFAPTTNSSAVVRALDSELSGACPVVGGLTGDHRDSMRQTVEFFGGEVLHDSLPALFLSGEVRCGHGLGSGWFPIGGTHVVTRSDGHVVQEIDGKPALDLYREHYGAIPGSSLSEYPLAVYMSDEAWSLRAIMDSDRETGALRFAGEVPVGSTVRITEVMKEGILSGSTLSLQRAMESFEGSSPEAALVFTCAARKWVLGTQAEREIDELRACARGQGAADLDIAGLYVFGEICPLEGAPAFHNETCVSLVLGR